MLRLVVFLFVLNTCNELPYENHTALFEKQNCEDLLYKQALVKVVKSDSCRKIKYFLEGYRVINGQPQLLIKITADGLNANVWMNIPNNQLTLHPLLKNKGQGYHGAELKELAYSVIEDSTHLDFIINKVEGIVD